MSTRGHGSLLAYSSKAPADVQAAAAAAAGGSGSGGGAAGGGTSMPSVHIVLFEYDERCGALRMEVPPGLPLEVDWAVRFA